MGSHELVCQRAFSWSFSASPSPKEALSEMDIFPHLIIWLVVIHYVPVVLCSPLLAIARHLSSLLYVMTCMPHPILSGGGLKGNYAVRILMITLCMHGELCARTLQLRERVWAGVCLPP